MALQAINMRTRKNLGVWLTIVGSILLLGAKLHAQVLFADNFNRSSSTVGSTSTGGYAWIENESNSFALWVNGTQLVFNGGGGESSAKTGNLYANYNLDSVVDYQIDFTLTSGVPAVSTGAAYYTTIQVRGNGTTTAEGWRFSRNSSGLIDLYYYNGTSQTLVTSGLFTANVATGVSILVMDNIATLTIGSFTDSRTLSTFANDSISDYVGFDSSAYSRSYIDNLTVTAVPEPNIWILTSSGFMILLFKNRRKFKSIEVI